MLFFRPQLRGSVVQHWLFPAAFDRLRSLSPCTGCLALRNSVPRFLLPIFWKLQHQLELSAKAFSELRSTFPKIPKDLAKWKYFTHWKILIFSENQFWYFCETISLSAHRFLKNTYIFIKIVSQKDQKSFSEKNKTFQYVKHFHFAKSFGILKKVGLSSEKTLAQNCSSCCRFQNIASQNRSTEFLSAEQPT